MKNYAYFDSKTALRELKTSLNGLTSKESSHRLNKYGLNELPKEEKKNLFQIFLNAFKDPIIYVLLPRFVI